MAASRVPRLLACTAASKWVWFQNDYDARSRAREEFANLPVDARAKLDVAMSRHLRGDSRAGDVDHLGHGIYELRVRHLNNQYRLLFMGWGVHRVVLTAFRKNQQKTPKTDLQRATKRGTRWLELFADPTEAE
ncbi:type II toxin-antitoxin system RelE/ParE family toxin [Rhodococcus sp. NBC_00294]|uniref:type II toxin-antitoxin system RelE/ParE family toxin n=1 Tax=Rhodococcus sp. NBC_00294 TaxID=2976004 RepID=UPI002E2C4344|nr:type II toxin-antitoxin system RelE/ParE family toxin [Rhodococcus sp. NBC_00294]